MTHVILLVIDLVFMAVYKSVSIFASPSFKLITLITLSSNEKSEKCEKIMVKFKDG